ncbi:adherence factor [Chlamydia psittaci]|uniref:adherence factor n=1 Tax=Chlamydia psittaci TaxID=83554 RepID=UPI002024A104|nr:adherence factor [Chlamydia psittaci]
MRVNFFSPIRFSQHCLDEMAQAKRPIVLEKLSGRLDDILFQSSKGIEVKSVETNGTLLCDRIQVVDSIASLCLKALLVILVIPVIIALALKVIVRLYLYLQYSGKIREQEQAQELEEPVIPLVEAVTPPVLSRADIIEKFLTVELSSEQRKLLIKSTELLCSRGCASKEEYKERGILVDNVSRYHCNLPIEFRLTEIPGCSFIHYPGFLRTWDDGSQDIVTSVTKTCEVSRDRLDNTANFLLGVPVREGMTQEEVENLIQQGRQTNARLGVFGLETFYIGQTTFSLGGHVGVLIIKDLV